MSETVFFNIPEPVDGQNPIYRINWYQSTDGNSWGQTPVDTTLVSGGSLVLINAEQNRYSWTSSLVDSYKYHLLKTEDAFGAESVTGIIFLPDPLAASQLNVVRATEGTSIFKPGQAMSLMLEVDQDAYDIIGPTVTVRITDKWDNLITQIGVEHIGEGIPFYEGAFTIPNNIDTLYNTGNADEAGLDPSLYYLKDTWIFPNNTQVSYEFFVERSGVDQAVQNDCIYIINIGRVNGSNVNETIQFTSALTKYYATVEDVYSLAPYLKAGDALDLVRQISLRSQFVDLHMKPNIIHDAERFMSAVRCYVAKQSALDKAKVDAGLTSELKQLDTMQIQKTYDIRMRMSILEGESDQCANIIYAGGLTTPFKTRLFIKGINDPNRPTYGRASFDEFVKSPYLNYSTRSLIFTGSDGNIIEYRGTRTVKVTEDPIAITYTTEGSND